MFDTDVFVLGGGPAGLAAAIAARQAGFRVILADAQRPPIDKVCGEGLMPDSLAAARQLGIPLTCEHGHPLRGIRFHANPNQQHSVCASFPNGTGLGVRRPVLHSLLVERAAQLGVELLWNHPVTALHGNSITLSSRQLQSRWIIGADGTQSSIRRWAGLLSFRRDSQRFAYRRHFRVAPWSACVEVYWAAYLQFYVTPVAANEVSVVLMTRNPQHRINGVLPQVPALQRHLAGCEATTPERGALAATRHLHRVTRGPVALIGDASGTVDPITGEGLCLAFKQAGALAAALVEDDLKQYELAHAQLTRRPRFMSDFMLLMDRSPRLMTRTLAAFAAHPHLFANLLALHVGELPAARFLTTAAALGWQVALG